MTYIIVEYHPEINLFQDDVAERFITASANVMPVLNGLF